MTIERMTGCSNNMALGGTTLVEQAVSRHLPLTVTLNSSDATRKIELSTNNQVEFFVPVYDVISTTMLVVVLNAGVSHIRFTGLATDTRGYA